MEFLGTDLKRPSDGRSAFGPKLLLSADKVRNSVTTPTALTDANGNWTIPVVAGEVYRVTLMGNYYSSSNANGIRFGFFETSSAAGFYTGEVSVQDDTAGTPFSTTFSAGEFNRPGVSGGSDFAIRVDFIAVISASGNLEFRLGSSSSIAATTLRANSVLMWERLA